MLWAITAPDLASAESPSLTVPSTRPSASITACAPSSVSPDSDGTDTHCPLTFSKTSLSRDCQPGVRFTETTVPTARSLCTFATSTVRTPAPLSASSASFSLQPVMSSR